jgi:molybdate transport system regulatory protein
MAKATTVHPRSKPARLCPRVKVWLEMGGAYAFGLGICEILQAVDRAGSIKQAAAELGKSYRHVWQRVKEAEEGLGRPLVEPRVGGQGVRHSALTAEAHRLVGTFLLFRKRMLQRLQQEFARSFSL